MGIWIVAGVILVLLLALLFAWKVCRRLLQIAVQLKVQLKEQVRITEEQEKLLCKTLATINEMRGESVG